MKEFTPIWAWVVLGLAAIISLGVDVYNTLPGGSIDLRNRVTGTRVMMAQIPPYHYKWHKGELPEYCDPFNNPALPVNKVTATPTSLLFLLPVAAMPYREGQFAWLFLQWALLGGTAWLWMRKCETSRQQLMLAAFTVGFTYTAAWRLHAERGQAYVLILFVFACWLVLTLDPKKGNGFWAGCVAGLAIALRPPFLLLAPFLLVHRRGQLIGAAVGLMLSAGLPLLINHDAWTDYFSAMNDYAKITASGIDTPFQAQAYPNTIEDIPLDMLAHFAVIPFADFSAYVLLHIGGFNSVPSLAVLLVAVIPFGIWLWLSRGQTIEELMLGLVAWFFVIDLFLPSFRNNYNDVMILNVMAVGLIMSQRIPWGAWPCLLALPVGWAVYGLTLPKAWMIDAPSFLFTVGALAFLFWKEPAPEPKRSPSSAAGRRAGSRRSAS